VTAPDRPLIAILDYGIGNLHSAQKGFAHAGADARLTRDRGLISEAAGVVLPGVGAFGPCMNALRSTGLDDIALEMIEADVPFFGICIGMQVLFSASDEAPGLEGLGVFGQHIHQLPDGVKRPQMQWNIIEKVQPNHAMFEGLPEEAWAYFVHSYSAEPGPDVIATCDYGAHLVAAVARDNIWAAQFHPEKSAEVGLRILSNFVAASAKRSGVDS